MGSVFTVAIKFPPGSKVYFADTSGAYLPAYHPRIYSDEVESFAIQVGGEPFYHFRYGSSHSRNESVLFSTPEEVVAWLEADIDRQVVEMKAETRALLDHPIKHHEYNR